MRVLLVEDSIRLRKSLTRALRQTGYAVDAEENGEEGLWLAQNHSYDVAVLDIMLPGMDGLSMVQHMRKEGNNTPVLFLTAKDTVDDRVRGLSSGADDYLVKPFALEELLARVHALCRRGYNQPSNLLKIDDLELDVAAKKASRADRAIDLTPREFKLLHFLMLRHGQVVSRTEIEERIYDDLASPISNVVDAAVYQLRKKIATYPEARPLIHTRRGQGYVLEDRGS